MPTDEQKKSENEKPFNPFTDDVLENPIDFSGACNVSLTIDGKKISYDIYRLDLIQQIDNHHVAKVLIRELGQDTSEMDFSEAIGYTDFLGKSISISIEAEIINESAPVKSTFVGTITRVELKNSINGINVGIVTAQSPTIAMDGAKHNCFFMDQKASDVIGSILRNYPITVGKTESTDGQMKFCVQYRETDYDFIMRLATGSGLFAYYDGEKFNVEKAHQSNTIELAWRYTLGAFVYGLGTASTEFTSSVYNYEQKKTFDQDSKSLPLQSSVSEMSRKSTDASKKIFTKSGFSESPKFVADAQGLDKALQNDRNKAIGQMILCHGSCSQPQVAPGKCVKVNGMAKMDGSYWVTKVHHTFAKSSYTNKFECVPIDVAHPKAHSNRATITNLQTAEVVDNIDPDKMGRIKVKFPWNADDTIWIRVAVPHAGKDRGWFSIPEIGDEVLVGYEQGSPDLPIVIGSLYNKDNAPHGDTGTDDNSVKGFITKSGNKIVINDSGGGEQIGIIAADGSQVIIESGGPSITIETAGDVTIKAKNITLKADSKIVLDGGQIEIKSGGDIKSEASMNMATKAGIEYKIEGTMVTVKGTPIQLN
ncbi:MAG: type VI secretion system tip protein VgrG [Candidatus Zixiibacteriota bacterium]